MNRGCQAPPVLAVAPPVRRHDLRRRQRGTEHRVEASVVSAARQDAREVSRIAVKWFGGGGSSQLYLDAIDACNCVAEFMVDGRWWWLQAS